MKGTGWAMATRKIELFIDHRRSVRHRVMLGATVCTPAGEPVEATVTDLSPHGFRATLPMTPDIGTTLRIEMPLGHALQAVVVWVSGSDVGCAFLAPLQEDEVRLVAEIWDYPIAS